MMKVAVCFLAVLGCALALPDLDWSKIKPINIYAEPTNLVKEAPGPRIIGGVEVNRNSVPHQVAIIVNGQGFCGGSLISPVWVLTAGHCTNGATYIEVIAGAHNINQAESTQQIVTSRNIITHPSYSSNSLAEDVGLINLPTALTLNSYVQVIALAPENAGTYAGSTAFLSGWGRTTDDSNAISPVLQGVTLSIITNAECGSVYTNIVIPSNICTSGSGSVGGCNGDSGGALIVGSTQVGIVSFGATQCAAGYPTAFARVSSYRSWITSTTGV